MGMIIIYAGVEVTDNGGLYKYTTLGWVSCKNPPPSDGGCCKTYRYAILKY